MTRTRLPVALSRTHRRVIRDRDRLAAIARLLELGQQVGVWHVAGPKTTGTQHAAAA